MYLLVRLHCDLAAVDACITVILSQQLRHHCDVSTAAVFTVMFRELKHHSLHHRDAPAAEASCTHCITVMLLQLRHHACTHCITVMLLQLRHHARTASL
jgi:hypothetical protein